ncbi:HAMP domain-containing histidine kinase [Bacillus sp. DNRA2]|uniref:sensor histidine kinase n=1 Tax=Bacillus sp. DNRA2 TaxID=2723053 RepID=UPI00145EB10A|nr:sensor histidine kinase [Bacillus sp. DNRA2]NMD71629.1 HAMP domain-containing histidine kinase [Bacillus sp. DNRA2]
MKLFIREHIPLLIFSLIQLTVVLAVIWFAGFRSILILSYAAFLFVFIMILYLAFRYFSEARLYNKLSAPPHTLDESITVTNSSPLAMAIDNMVDKQYRQYQEQLGKWEEKQQDRITFMNQWVHQMKTPLSVIELITQNEDDPRFESIAEETLRLRKGLEMALYTSRLESFTEDFFVQEVSLFEITSKVVSDNKQYFIRNYVYPELKVDQYLKIKTDGKWLRFVLDQIITNAIKYSVGSREKITITSLKNNNNVILEITDRGVGIPTSDLPRVFQPFFTGENGRLFKESTGMGLYLVKDVLGKLNHSIELDSKVGEGTTVRIIF